MVFNAEINLSELNGSNGFVINGIDTGDESGFSVSGVGDINGDGVDDIIIGAPDAEGLNDENRDAGESYVVFGSRSGFDASLDLSSLDGSNGFVLQKSDRIDRNQRLGTSVSNAGDINGDGIDDLIIGAPFPDANSFSVGESYVVFGSSDFEATLDLSNLTGDNGFVFQEDDRGDNLGTSVSSAGDINGDGIDDIIIGAPDVNSASNNVSAGASYVVFGSSDFEATLSSSSLNGSNGFALQGIDSFDDSGTSVSRAGDINGDGIDDIIIGAPRADGAGESYVVFGKDVDTEGNFEATFDLSNLDGSNGFTLQGVDSSGNSGFSVSSAGDVNGDGIDDLIIGDPSADPNNNNFAGESYVVFGKDVDTEGDFEATFNLSNLDGSNGFALQGIDSFDNSGFSVSGAGDINGDGIDDLIIGAPDADGGAGESYVVFGKDVANQGDFEATFDLSNLNGNNGFVFQGEDSGDQSGFSVSRAGDINGDGIDDLIIGAPSADPNNNNAGESYVVFGKDVANQGNFEATFDRSDLNGSNGFIINGVGSFIFSGRSVSGAGDVNGDGIDDIIIGTPDADQPDGFNGGQSYVVFGRAAQPSQPTLTVDDISILEGDSGTKTAQFTLNLSSAANQDISLDFATTEQTATAGIDFTSTSDTLTISEGETSATINVEIIGDTVFESDETFALELSNLSSGVTFEDNAESISATATILNDDSQPPNEITGTPGRDQLTGASENDKIIGGFGGDSLTGGGGDDQFVYQSIRDVGDIITDFEIGSDQIILTDVLDSFGYEGNDAIDDGFVEIESISSGSIVKLDADGADDQGIFRPFILVENVAAADLSAASNFVF